MIRQKSVRLGDILEACIPQNSALGKGLLTARVSAAYRQAVGSQAAAASLPYAPGHEPGRDTQDYKQHTRQRRSQIINLYII